MNDIPVELKLRRNSKLLLIRYADGRSFELPFEYLRVLSPSAEVRGHGGPAEGLPKILLFGKQDVDILRIEPVGNYAVRLVFDDGHDSGIYSWAVLATLCRRFETDWPDYLARLDKADVTRH